MAITPALRQAVYSAFGGRCFYSGRKINLEDAHVDHVFPQAKGGSDDYANLVLCASDINVSKQDCEINVTALRPLLEGVYAPRIAKHMDEQRCKELAKRELVSVVKHEPKKSRKRDGLFCMFGENGLPEFDRDMTWVEFGMANRQCVEFSPDVTPSIVDAVRRIWDLVCKCNGMRNWDDDDRVELINIPDDLWMLFWEKIVNVNVCARNGYWGRTLTPGFSGKNNGGNLLTVSPYAVRAYLDLLEA